MAHVQVALGAAGGIDIGLASLNIPIRLRVLCRPSNPSTPPITRGVPLSEFVYQVSDLEGLVAFSTLICS